MTFLVTSGHSVAARGRPTGTGRICTYTHATPLALTPGTRLGPYEITAQIGEGGMGEVYRARDSKLKRDVAIKVLPASVAADAARLARFQREAEILASLNDPHIAAIYGLEEQARARRPLVLELVEGPTLADRIAHGAIPPDEALPIAHQIALALEAAHDAGIIHRDLKPANIKVRPDGVVKVLDFGLARSPGAAARGRDASNSPTFTSPAMTAMGMILGTAAYMAPEQARGRLVDKRADIWAFGLVLYEMLAAAPRLPATPSPTSSPPSSRASRTGRRCPPRRLPPSDGCSRGASRRIQSAGCATSATRGWRSRRRSAGPSMETLSNPWRQRPRARATRGRTLAWTLAGVAMAAIAVAGLATWPRARQPDARPLRVSIVHTLGSEVAAPAISPDGRRVAYRARRADGMPLLWVRDLASGESQALPGTEDAFMPFWSPDSRDLGFFAGVALKRVSAAGGPVRVVADNVGIFGGAGGTWAADGTIVFSGQARLNRVSAEGGAVTARHHTAGRGLGAQLAEFPAGRPPVPVHREALDPDRGGQ